MRFRRLKVPSWTAEYLLAYVERHNLTTSPGLVRRGAAQPHCLGPHAPDKKTRERVNRKKGQGQAQGRYKWSDVNLDVNGAFGLFQKEL